MGMVNASATDSLVPRLHVEAINLKPEAKRTYLLADVTENQIDIAVARIEFMGEIVWAPRYVERKTSSRCTASQR